MAILWQKKMGGSGFWPAHPPKRSKMRFAIHFRSCLSPNPAPLRPLCLRAVLKRQFLMEKKQQIPSLMEQASMHQPQGAALCMGVLWMGCLPTAGTPVGVGSRCLPPTTSPLPLPVRRGVCLYSTTPLQNPTPRLPNLPAL